MLIYLNFYSPFGDVITDEAKALEKLAAASPSNLLPRTLPKGSASAQMANGAELVLSGDDDEIMTS